MPPRMTIPTQRVLAALLDEPERELYGIEIGERAELRSGTVHPILARLEGIGWLESRWEDVDASEAGRPPRRYYRLRGARRGTPRGGGRPAAPLRPAERRGGRDRPGRPRARRAPGPAPPAPGGGPVTPGPVPPGPVPPGPVPPGPVPPGPAPPGPGPPGPVPPGPATPGRVPAGVHLAVHVLPRAHRDR